MPRKEKDKVKLPLGLKEEGRDQVTSDLPKRVTPASSTGDAVTSDLPKKVTPASSKGDVVTSDLAKKVTPASSKGEENKSLFKFKGRVPRSHPSVKWVSQGYFSASVKKVKVKKLIEATLQLYPTQENIVKTISIKTNQRLYLPGV